MRWILACSLTLVAAACSGARERPEPPSGAVDPGASGLVTPGEAPRVGAPSVPRRSLPSEAPKKIVMTREHCETLGRKFAELAMAQAGAEGGPVDGEAKAMGQSFASGCVRDLAGHEVEAAEYQCMLRATAAEELLGCKR